MPGPGPLPASCSDLRSETSSVCRAQLVQRSAARRMLHAEATTRRPAGTSREPTGRHRLFHPEGELHVDGHGNGATQASSPLRRICDLSPVLEGGPFEKPQTKALFSPSCLGHSPHQEALGRALYLLAAGGLSVAGPQRNSSPRGPGARRLFVCLAWDLSSLTPFSRFSLLACLRSTVIPVSPARCH